jgi:WD40 repeat protein
LRIAAAFWGHVIGIHSGRVVGLFVLPDGRIASGSWDDTIRLWDVTAGAETGTGKRIGLDTGDQDGDGGGPVGQKAGDAADLTTKYRGGPAPALGDTFGLAHPLLHRSR